jgi:pimeloyl-ACP methyl ester carboxylesterase
MPYVHAPDGTRLFFSIWGSGEPVLFVHGGNVGSAVWEFQIPALVAQGFECITYDQRGFDRSDVSSSDYSLDTLTDDLDVLIRHLRRPSLSVVTLSFGSCVLARYLSRHGSDRIRKSALVSAVTPFFAKSADNPDGIDPELAYEPFCRGMVENRAQTFLDSLDLFFNPAAAEHPVTQGIRMWIMHLAMRNPLMAMIELYRVTFFADLRLDMRAFTMPTLLVHGEQDVFAPPAATAVRTHEMIPHSKLISYPGASHGLMFTHHDRLNRDLGDFLRTEKSEIGPQQSPQA